LKVVSNTRKHQDLWRSIGARSDDDLTTVVDIDSLTVCELDADSYLRIVEQPEMSTINLD
jgi:hypothetical protein